MKVEAMNSSVSSSYQGQGRSMAVDAVKPVSIETEANTSAAMSFGKETEITNAAGHDVLERGTSRENGQASDVQIRQAVEKINKNTEREEAVFGIHEGTNRVTIKIVDKETKEVIKEFPPEKTLDMIARVWEMAGIMVDEKR